MSTTRARTTVDNFSAAEVGISRTPRGSIFFDITECCAIMLGHSSSTAEEIAEEIVALRKLAEVATEVAAELERRPKVAEVDVANHADLLARVQQIAPHEGSGPVPPDAAGPGIMAAPFARAEDYPHRDTYAKEGPA